MGHDVPPRGLWRQVCLWLLVAAAYITAGKLGLALAFVNASATAVWPPTGIALAAILIFGRRVWPGIFLGAFFVNHAIAGSVATSLAIATGNTLEMLAAGWLVGRFAGGRAALRRAPGIFRFVLLAGLLSTAISATIGVTSLSLGGFARWSEFRSLWLTWWLGDAVGAIVVAPALLCWSADPTFTRWRTRGLELALVLAMLIGVGLTVFVATSAPVGFLALPVCVWVAFRFGQREAASATCVLSAIATWGTVHGYGSFAAEQTPNTALLYLQAFMAVITLVGLTVGAGVEERARSQEQARQLNLTASKAAEDFLRRSEQRLKTIIDAEPACVKLVSPDGLLLQMNPAGLEMLGATDISQVAGHRVVDIVHADDRERFVDAHRAASAGAPGRLQFRIVGLDGTQRWVDSHMVPFDTPANGSDARRTVLSVTSDVTSQRQLEDQLRQAQKLDALGRLVGSVAHDFNNFLTALVGYTELALRQIGDDERVYPDLKNDLKEVLNVTHRASALTKQLLIFSRRPTLDAKPVSVDGVLTPLGPMIAELIGPEVSVRTLFSSGETRVRIDPNHLEQIVMNLAVNARDAMPNGGEVIIETCVVSVDETFAADRAVSPGPYVRLSVADSGVGMTDFVKGHLFEPFFTTKPVGQGTGLGLATVYGIVKQSGGYVWVTSQPGHGTTFTIHFPLVPESLAIESGPRVAPVATDDNATVLVVDDDDDVRAVARDVLREHGYRVLEARTGEEATQLSAAYGSTIHVIVSDVILPGMNGPDLVGRLRRSRPDLRALFISGYGHLAIVHHGLLDGEAVLIEKPFSSEQLLAYVRAALTGIAASTRADN
jgi:PAS domain S-box-containing protein